MGFGGFESLRYWGFESQVLRYRVFVRNFTKFLAFS